jgi:hypothetical protein
MGLNNYLGNGRNFPPRNAREQGTGMDLLSAGPLSLSVLASPHDSQRRKE